MFVVLLSGKVKLLEMNLIACLISKSTDKFSHSNSPVVMTREGVGESGSVIVDHWSEKQILDVTKS